MMGGCGNLRRRAIFEGMIESPNSRYPKTVEMRSNHISTKSMVRKISVNVKVASQTPKLDSTKPATKMANKA